MSQHYQEIVQAFDKAAASYDQVYGPNQIMAWMRSMSLKTLAEAFEPEDHLLEIGCGTGVEALTLARLGHRILATDISPKMIELARAKAQAAGLGGVRYRVLPAGQLSALEDDYRPGAFDGAFSSFGALNCEPSLAPVAQALAYLLRPGALLICSVMNRWCVWEIAWGLAHLRPRAAFRRLGRGLVVAGLDAPGGRRQVPTRYYTPRSFAHILGPFFELQSVRALPFLLPPPDYDPIVAQRPALWTKLEAADRRLADRFPFRAWGDHFLATLVRTEHSV
jgi:SAM-dependent methyltransferase